MVPRRSFPDYQVNLYVYVANDPVNFTDPGGLDPLPAGSNGSNASCPVGTSRISVDGPCINANDITVTGRPRPRSELPEIMRTLPTLPAEIGDDIVVTARKLNSREVKFYSTCYDRNTLRNITLHRGVPWIFRLGGADGFTDGFDIYLSPDAFDNPLSSSVNAQLLGHELFHSAIQYGINGVTIGNIGESYIQCNCYRNSQFEAPAYNIQRSIDRIYRGTFP